MTPEQQMVAVVLIIAILAFLLPLALSPEDDPDDNPY